MRRHPDRSIKLVVAVTDDDWFETLRQQSNLDEVNFWKPSHGQAFRALDPGELFLFKLRAPRNAIVGGGIFTHASTLPCSVAWEVFGKANGARSAQELRTRIIKYRGRDDSDFTIGCRILTQPFFLDKNDWIRVPENWSPNIVSLKGYNTGDVEGRALWEAVNDHLRRRLVPDMVGDQARFGEPHLIRPRLGQGAFRTRVIDLYERRCAVTGERTLPALEAAHIQPYSAGGAHEMRNGILLRSDIHHLFDAGYVTVTPDLHFEVSHRIREEFENGRHYYALHGERIHVPRDAPLCSDPGALRWHNEHCFQDG